MQNIKAWFSIYKHRCSNILPLHLNSKVSASFFYIYAPLLFIQNNKILNQLNFQNVKIELFYFSNETSLEKKFNFTSKLEYLLKRKLCFMKHIFRIHYP